MVSAYLIIFPKQNRCVLSFLFSLRLPFVVALTFGYEKQSFVLWFFDCIFTRLTKQKSPADIIQRCQVHCRIDSGAKIR